MILNSIKLNLFPKYDFLGLEEIQRKDWICYLIFLKNLKRKKLKLMLF